MTDIAPTTFVMIVDDNPENLHLLEGLLREQGLGVNVFPRGDLALKAARKKAPDLILLDIRMPDMDGFEVCRRLKEDDALTEVPVLFISALTEAEDKVRAFAAGGVDYVTKPFQPEEIRARVETHLHQRRLWKELETQKNRMEELVQEQVREMSRSYLHTMHALSALLESQEDETAGHIQRVRAYCLLLAQSMLRALRPQGSADDAAFIQQLEQAAGLHDIGKFGIPEGEQTRTNRVAAKKIESMKSHTVIGEKTLLNAFTRHPRRHFLKMAMAIARSHHEKWDGSGYPDQLSGTTIPLPARILAVADAYDGLRADMPYKPALGHDQSIRIIQHGAGEYFDPQVVNALTKVRDSFAQAHDAETHPEAQGLEKIAARAGGEQ
jgi:putative two-component system response regulator